MKTSTTENIQKRHEWLKNILDGKISLSKDQQEKLVDMKSFCSLKVPKLFDKISYNTLKCFCLSQPIPGAPELTENYWEYLISLRKRIYTTYKNKESEANTLNKPTEKMLINEAFNQAQLASIAYLELYQFIKTTIESDLTLNESTKQVITNFLYESILKFENITSYSTVTPKTWSIIQGGKGDA